MQKNARYFWRKVSKLGNHVSKLKAMHRESFHSSTRNLGLMRRILPTAVFIYGPCPRT